ncbi:hypothetical protein [Silvibacterium acidisoli]|uniref:hypothetical protein n=1 Tax=Acidobacteriaceae bacterium ZG23-2 TaxID=2883246 RepID=UPI00406CF67C
MNWIQARSWCAAAIIGLLATAADAQMLEGKSLTEALKAGGYVVVMRHASAPQAPPAQGEAASGNSSGERQLDQAGIDSATQMGVALRKLRIPIGAVYSSPTFRALETVRYAELGNPIVVPELGDHGVSMSGVEASQTAWLHAAVTHFEAGKNTFIVTHMPNITAAFPNQAGGLKDGEALIFGPDGKGGTRLVARVAIGEWSKLQE